MDRNGSIPLGMMRHDELLNALLAIWKTQHNLACRSEPDEFDQAYHLGFEESLEAVAQAAGLTDAFEAGKVAHQERRKDRRNSRIKVIDSRVTVIEG